MELRRMGGWNVYCKLDHLQITGSFKERGGRNKLLLLSDEQKRRGVVAASAGNHALGLAYHGKLLGIPVTVVMPQYAPLIKITTCQRLSAKVVVAGNSLAEARERADELAQEQKLTYIRGYDDWNIIAGQGTVGLESLDQVPELDAIVVPIGGGGLIAGVGLAIKALKPSVKIVGVAAQHTPSFSSALAAGKPVSVQNEATLADGLAVPSVGTNAFEIAREVVDQFGVVSEGEIALAILRILELEKSVVEGAAASALAALLSGKLPELTCKHAMCPFCAGNLSPCL